MFKLGSETNDVMESNIYANSEDESKSVTLASNEGNKFTFNDICYLHFYDKPFERCM